MNIMIINDTHEKPFLLFIIVENEQLNDLRCTRSQVINLLSEN